MGRGHSHRGGSYGKRRGGGAYEEQLQQFRAKAPKVVVDENSPVIQMFRTFQCELDADHDRYERLVKLSRDTTIESKRVIFLLQRVSGLDEDEQSKTMEEALLKIKELQATKLYLIAVELEGQDPYNYARAFSPGLQEYIEAVSFYHYIKDSRLITYDEIQNDLKFQKKPAVKHDSPNKQESPSKDKTDSMEVCDTKTEEKSAPDCDAPMCEISTYVNPIDYILGVADLTGELMRLAINNVGSGQLTVPFTLCNFIRVIHNGFLSFDNLSRELRRKLFTLQQSLKKVETACYTLQVRGSEIPKHLLADVFSDMAVKFFDEADDPNEAD